MGILGKIFTWWNDATVTTLLNSALTGEKVGSDAQGNTYDRAKKPFPKGHPWAGRERRWVIYNGANDASRIPAEWHGWLHGSFDGLPESNLPPPRQWETEYSPNATGSSAAYSPAHVVRDYESWSPDA